ncbi:phosphate:Na+ symporter [Dongia mobilis]|uniref:Phosphate:Na+ symporter n=2 Tax=Dongia mobilis TaxID=578943 RepID=A0A4R6WX68_9PROT|nr:phosphate:Na+ symporter [Dongia mobilis]
MIAATLIGGIGLFLLGMWLMTEGLRVAAGDALRVILQNWIKSGLQGVLAGILITAIVQSSTIVTVATLGFVNAGLMSLGQAIWVIFGTNIGTTMTGWLVAVIGVKVDIGALALPLIGIGMLGRLVFGRNLRRAGLGQALAGFGVFFLGINVLQAGFADLAPLVAAEAIAPPGWTGRLLFLGLGFVLTQLTQSSSASIAIILTASAGGSVPFDLGAAAVIGTNIGTTTTAFLAALGATASAKRVASAHIAFNLLTGIVALLVLPPLTHVTDFLTTALGMANDMPMRLAIFHTIFNILGVLLIWPLAAPLVRFLSRRFVTPAESLGRPRHLDQTITAVPALALRSLVLELLRMRDMAFAAATRRVVDASAASADVLAQEEGVAALGQAVRAFIAGLSAGPLPDDVVAALPDLLRATQHLEEVTRRAAGLAPSGPSPSHEMGNLRKAVLASLAGPAGRAETERETGPALDASGELAVFAAAVEDHYQKAKTELLRGAATGSLSLDAMEAAQRQAQLLRRCADAASKAQRRLLPWLERAADPAPQGNGPAQTTPPESPAASANAGGQDEAAAAGRAE